MVNTRKAIELLYDCTCDIVELQSYQRANKSTGKNEVKVVTAEPCRVSFNSNASTNEGVAAVVTQTIKLFIKPELDIQPGSKIIVTDKHGRITEYKNSGQPALYSHHQEIVMDLFERWA